MSRTEYASAVLLIVGIFLLFLAPSPWNVVAFAVCLVLFFGELFLWNRTVRHRGVRAGAETLIGRHGTVIAACRPDGQVRLQGEIWEARCAEGADPGDEVVVRTRDGLGLVVERLGSA